MPAVAGRQESPNLVTPQTPTQAAQAPTARSYPHPLSRATSAVMRRNPPENTEPEVAIRRALHRLGYRFRKNFTIRLRRGWTRPDIVFTKHRIAIYLDGCFWHGCPWHGQQPKHNAWYWSPKFESNRARDRRNALHLRRMGWRVLRIWEHVAPTAAVRRITALLSRVRGRTPLPRS